MNIHLIKTSSLLLGATILVSACSVAKLEARLEANPQCKDVVNPKTGALMPCPGSDKAFYREVGLAPAKPAPVISSSAAAIPAIVGSKSSDQVSANSTAGVLVGPAKLLPTQADCKPQIHKKTGVTLPCPAPE
jgi:hypothetical protein